MESQRILQVRAGPVRTAPTTARTTRKSSTPRNAIRTTGEERYATALVIVLAAVFVVAAGLAFQSWLDDRARRAEAEEALRRTGTFAATSYRGRAEGLIWNALVTVFRPVGGRLGRAGEPPPLSTLAAAVEAAERCRCTAVLPTRNLFPARPAVERTRVHRRAPDPAREAVAGRHGPLSHASGALRARVRQHVGHGGARMGAGLLHVLPRYRSAASRSLRLRGRPRRVCADGLRPGLARAAADRADHLRLGSERNPLLAPSRGRRPPHPVRERCTRHAAAGYHPPRGEPG